MTTLALFLMLQAPAPAAAVAGGQELTQVKNVYILPMGNGFDQFLANALTRRGLVQVVTDPAKADAIFTDRLGKGFEQKMGELYPEPKVEEAPKTAKEKDAKDAKDADEKGEDAMPGRFDVKNTLPERTSNFGRGRGTYFLVNRATRNVVWSVYEKPSTTRPDDLNDTARDVAGELARAIGRQAKGQR